MAIVTLSLAKAHLRVNHALDDTLITLHIGAAEKRIANFLNLDAVPIQEDIQAAALLLIGDLYENREAQTEKPLIENEAVCNLLFPYRVNMGI